MTTAMAAPTAPATPPMAIQMSDVRKSYGDMHALQGVNLDVPAGSLFGLIGPNGAGKSTAMAIIASLLARNGGTVLVGGADPARHPQEVRRRIGYVPDVMGVYDNLNVVEYLQFFAGAYGIRSSSWPALVDKLLELVDLADKREAMVDSLSRGMKQRLSLARALVHDPEVLVLDEPASGLDPRARVELRMLLVDLQGLGKTVLVSSHILSELEEMCSHVAIMDRGKVLTSGAPNALRLQFSTGRKIRVRLAWGEERQYEVADDEEQRTLVHRLIAIDGLPVLEVTQVDAGLENLFLEVTAERGADQA